jgi:poly(A) polymerase/tRNA nucleotidyltransferase (CCA-adding enzyme)
MYMDIQIPDYVTEIAENLHNSGYEAWVVGGSIRDVLIGRPAYDHDIATNALPHEVMKLFSRSLPTGLRHGTVTVLTKGEGVEVTTYRSDGKYSDARHPDSVTYAQTIHEDLSRRDFTVNGLAYNPITDELIDPYGGARDIEKKLIRTIGNPIDRFNEDGLRPYRACRLASQLGFTIEHRTFGAIPACRSRAAQVSLERVRDEFIKILQSPKPSVGIELLRKSGLLELFLPELITGHGINQNVYHRYDVYYHNLYSCDAAVADDYRIRLAALLHDIGKPYAKKEIEGSNRGKKSVFYNHEIIGAAITKRIMRRLKLSNQDIRTVTHLIRNHMFHYTHLWTDGAVRRFMRKVGLENLEALFELRRADRIGNGLKQGESRAVQNLKQRIEKVLEDQNAITVRDLVINGNDVMRTFDLQPGPVVGRVLNHLLEEILDDPEKNEQDTLLRIAAGYLKKNPPQDSTEDVRPVSTPASKPVSMKKGR